MLKILVITNMPVHHQIDLFDEIHSKGKIKLHVVYLRTMSYGRKWNVSPNLYHPHTFLPEIRIWKHWYLNHGAYKFFRDFKCDGVVICQYAAVSYQIAMWKFKKRGIPFVFWSEPISGVRHQKDSLLPFEWMRSVFRKIALIQIKNKSEGLWAIGSKARQSFEGINSRMNHVENLPYFSDLSRFKNLANSGNKSKIRFLFSGSLSKRKGFDLVIKAVKILLKEGRQDQFKVIVIGEGYLRSLITPDLVNVIKYYGFVQHKDVFKYYQGSDITLFPSRYDGWGMTLVESLAAGNPAISTYETGAAIELIKDKHSGFIINPIDVENLYSKMLWFLRNKQKISNMSILARKSIQKLDKVNGAIRFDQLSIKYFK